MTRGELIGHARRAWAERTVREQTLLLAGCALALACVVWVFAVSPVLGWRSEAKRDYAASVAEHAEMGAGLARWRTLSERESVGGGAGEAAGEDTALRTLVARAAREGGIPVTRVLPDEQGRLNVWVDPVAASELMGWLDGLSRSQGVRASRISLDRGEAGTVRAQLLLARGA